jgi:L-fuculose-phosphate aldolase
VAAAAHSGEAATRKQIVAACTFASIDVVPTSGQSSTPIPPVATAFAVAGETFESPVLPEVVRGLGPIALVPYATPGTEGLADRLEPLLSQHDVFLLSNHGATTVGPSLTVAYGRMESLEHSARILLAARLLGRVRTLTAEQVRDLVAARDEAGRPGPYGGGTPPGDGLETE